MKVIDTVSNFGQRLGTLLDEMGYSQNEFANICGLHRSYINHLMCNRRYPSYENLIRLCAALNNYDQQVFLALGK